MRIVVVGDSTAEATGAGVVAWAAANPSRAQVELVTGAGCGLVLGGFQDLGIFGNRDVDAACAPYVRDVIGKKVAALRPDVVMVLTTVWDVLDRSLTKGAPALSPTDPELETAMRNSLGEFTDSLIAMGVPRVAWIQEPVPLPTATADDDQQADPARHAVLHRIIDDIASSRPQVRVVDLADWVAASPWATDQSARPDSVHWTTDVSARIADEFLGQALLRAALQ